MPVISIIVPVYNVADFLPKCIESILAQTLSDFELILIDDGSTDNSLQVLREYEKKDARICVVAQENAGVSAARNAGLDMAHGDYIGFVDSDDEILPTMLEEMISVSEKYDADVVCCTFGKIIDDKPQIKHTSGHFTEYSGAELIHWFYSTTFGYSCWNKIYRRRLFETVRFPVGRSYAEDSAVTYQTLHLANKMVLFEKDLYLYRIREGSALTKSFHINRLQEIDTFRELHCFTRENYPALEPLARKEYLKSIYRHLAPFARYVDSADDNTYLTYFHDIRKNWLFMLRNVTFSTKEKIAFCEVLLGSKIYYYLANRK